MLGVAAATALPSEVWPFKKIFLPPAPRIVPLRFQYLMWNESQAQWVVHPEQAKLLEEMGLYHPVDLSTLPSARAATYLGLSRASYPGRLTRFDILAPWPEDIPITGRIAL